MEDLGIAPNWSGSITFKTAGPIWNLTTKSSAILEMEGVGRNWFLMSLTGFFFGTGITSAFFQRVGKRCSAKLRFRTEVIG